MSGRADVLVIGAGPSGAIVSLVLAEAGKKVVCLEQGGWTRGEDHPHADPDWEWRRFADWAPDPNVRGRADDYPVDTDDEHALMWAGVGGASVIYTALWPRLRPSDFRKGTEHGLAPDWPITYEDLAPFYDRTDLLLGTAGLVGDPGMPPRGPFATPPMPAGACGRHIAAALEGLGWHHWPFPVAALSQDHEGRQGCNFCGGCFVGCSRGALADASVAVWPRALAAGAELRTGARVERLELDGSGRLAGAVYVDRSNGQRRRQEADLVVLCANGVGTARLLLLSANGAFPEGLANRSGQVGRNLMHHTLVGAEYRVDAPLESHKGMIGAMISSEFAETDTRRGFVNGFNLNIVRAPAPGSLAVGAFSGRRAPWGEAHHAWFRRRFGHGFRAYAIGDDLPQADNRVTLSDRLFDGDGLPAPRITYRPHENDWRQMRWAKGRLVELGQAAGAFETLINDYVGTDGRYRTPAWHLLGTCRMGEDPESSVVDRWHRAWDVPNLYVVDGSVMPTGGVVNPTSTVCALALRAAEHLRDEVARA